MQSMRFIALLRADLKSVLFKIIPVALTIAVLLCAFLSVLPEKLFSGGEALSINVAIVSDDDDSQLDIIPQMLKAVGAIGEVWSTDAVTAQSQLSSGQADIVVHLPENLVNALATGSEATITVMANDYFYGNICKQVGSVIVRAANQIQSASLAFNESAKEAFEDKSDYYAAANSFNTTLIRELLSSGLYVKVIKPVSGLALQTLTLALLCTLSVVVVAMCISADRLLTKDYIRRLRLHRIPFFCVWVSKALVTVALSLLFTAAVYFVLQKLGIIVVAKRLFLAAFTISLILFCICFAFVRFKSEGEKNGSFTLLGCFAVLLVLLFFGGGFFPNYSMSLYLQGFNPVWLAHLFCEWALDGAAVSPGQAAGYAVLPLACTAFSYWKWRRCLC